MPTSRYDIDERVFRFACDVVTFVRTIQWEPRVNKIVEQLVNAAGSTGANRHEATGCAPGREFIRANVIALREARESHLWLRVCHAMSIVVNAKAILPEEGLELAATKQNDQVKS